MPAPPVWYILLSSCTFHIFFHIFHFCYFCILLLYLFRFSNNKKKRNQNLVNSPIFVVGKKRIGDPNFFGKVTAQSENFSLLRERKPLVFPVLIQVHRYRIILRNHASFIIENQKFTLDGTPRCARITSFSRACFIIPRYTREQITEKFIVQCQCLYCDPFRSRFN